MPAPDRLRALAQRILSACPPRGARRILVISAILDALLVYRPQRWRRAAAVFLLAKLSLVADIALRTSMVRAEDRTISELRRLWHEDRPRPQ